MRWLFLAAVATSACQQTPGELHVYAASSLTEATQNIAKNAQTKLNRPVRVHTGGSQVLRTQLMQSADAALFISAHPEHVHALGDRVARQQTWAYNQLVLVVPEDNPARIATLKDLPQAQRLVLGSPSAPIGRHAEKALARLDLKDLNAVSREPNVRLVRAKVELGAADAAVIYATDALERPRLKKVAAFPNATIEIQLAELQGAPPELYDFFSSATSQAILHKFGFKTP